MGPYQFLSYRCKNQIMASPATDKRPPGEELFEGAGSINIDYTNRNTLFTMQLSTKPREVMHRKVLH